MIRYYKHEKAYLDIATCYQHIYDTPIVKESNEWQKEMENMILFVILAHFDPHQYDFMLRISKDKNLEANGLAVFKDILTKFISTELIDWPEFQKTYSRLQQHPVFVEDKSRWDILGNRIVEHVCYNTLNINMIESPSCRKILFQNSYKETCSTFAPRPRKD